MEERWPWEAEESLEASDPFAHQRHEAAVKEQLPRVVKLLPVQGTVKEKGTSVMVAPSFCPGPLSRSTTRSDTRP